MSVQADTVYAIRMAQLLTETHHLLLPSLHTSHPSLSIDYSDGRWPLQVGVWLRHTEITMSPADIPAM